MKLFATLVVVMVVLTTAVAQTTSGIAISLYLRSKALIFCVLSYKRLTTKFDPNRFDFNNVWLVHAKCQDDFITSKYWRKLINH